MSPRTGRCSTSPPPSPPAANRSSCCPINPSSSAAPCRQPPPTPCAPRALPVPSPASASSCSNIRRCPTTARGGSGTETGCSTNSPWPRRPSRPIARRARRPTQLRHRKGFPSPPTTCSPTTSILMAIPSPFSISPNRPTAPVRWCSMATAPSRIPRLTPPSPAMPCSRIAPPTASRPACPSPSPSP